MALIGSTKKESANARIIEKFRSETAGFFDVRVFPIDILPYFNPDLENDDLLPESVKNFRNCLENAAGVVICTPEYVFSLPGVLKNALEWTVSTILFNDKPTALITAASVGEKAQESLGLVMKTIGAKVGIYSSILIKNVRTKINQNGEFINENTEKEFNDLIKDFKNNLIENK
jgi:chromate reductase, NAD(P)H dehydrogenase (quinone)